MQMESENEDLQRRSNGGGIGDKYLMARRHTVGPGDTAHEQVGCDLFFVVLDFQLHLFQKSPSPVIDRQVKELLVCPHSVVL
jgi:hypothetical protein